MHSLTSFVACADAQKPKITFKTAVPPSRSSSVSTSSLSQSSLLLEPMRRRSSVNQSIHCSISLLSIQKDHLRYSHSFRNTYHSCIQITKLISPSATCLNTARWHVIRLDKLEIGIRRHLLFSSRCLSPAEDDPHDSRRDKDYDGGGRHSKSSDGRSGQFPWWRGVG